MTKSVPRKSIEQTEEFLANVFNLTREDFLKLGAGKMSATMDLKNTPEFWADAPWRLEPDIKDIPITFYIRDAEFLPPEYGPWRLVTICIDQLPDSGSWFNLATLTHKDCPGVDAQGLITNNFLVFGRTLQVAELVNPKMGETIHLRVIFTVSPRPYDKMEVIERHLEIFLAKFGLPMGRAEHHAGQRQWFYGDTHYHSSYTNDVKEYGGSIPETRLAAQAVGLDWLVVTDHSCDLGTIDAGFSGKNRWERLKTELSSAEISNEHFRFILGEEITLVGARKRFVHMLAIGKMIDMIPGAFLPDDSSNLYIDFWIKTIKKIVESAKGYPPDIAQSLFGKLYSLDEVLTKLPANTLTFAAHPYNDAQLPPAKWDKDDLAHVHLTGHEFWNGRARRKGGKTANPFDTKGWSDRDTIKDNDASRRRTLSQKVNNKWDPHLMKGVEDWNDPVSLPSQRPVFIAGSDAHGDFNYHAGWAWDYSDADMLDDNAIGRVRTVIFIPKHPADTVPEEETILAALKKGSCVVTDGPIIEVSLHQKGQIAQMGEVLLVDGPTEPELHIRAHTTEEFGTIRQVEVVTYFKDQEGKQPDHVRIRIGNQKTIQMKGFQGYCRVQAQSVGANGEKFNCYTNPIWIWNSGNKKESLHISFDQ